MEILVDWYRKNSDGAGIGFFQIGGGIAGDFPICVVPLIHQELKEKAQQFGLIGNAFDDVNEAIASARSVANAEDLVLVCGSNFLVAEVEGV